MKAVKTTLAKDCRISMHLIYPQLFKRCLSSVCKRRPSVVRTPYGARPMSPYPQWPFNTPYRRRGMFSSTNTILGTVRGLTERHWSYDYSCRRRSFAFGWNRRHTVPVDDFWPLCVRFYADRTAPGQRQAGKSAGPTFPHIGGAQDEFVLNWFVRFQRRPSGHRAVLGRERTITIIWKAPGA